MSQTIPRKYRDATSISPTQRVLVYAVLLLGSIGFFLPFYFIVNGSLKTNSEVQAGNLTSPPKSLGDIQWSNYPDALAADRMNFWPALANTVVITTLCMAGQIISCSLVGFGFARFRFRGRSILFMVMLSTMMLPAQVTMIPVFILFRWLGMIDSFWPLVIPAWLASPFFVFMFRQFFSQIPEELVEAARIDGASHWRVYWQLMMPLSGPVIAIVSIYTFLCRLERFHGSADLSQQHREPHADPGAQRVQRPIRRDGGPSPHGGQRRLHVAVHRAVLRGAEIFRGKCFDDGVEGVNFPAMPFTSVRIVGQ